MSITTPSTFRALWCPSACNDEWLFYEDHPVQYSVELADDGMIIVQDVRDVDYESGFDGRFECATCSYSIPANLVDFDRD